MTGRHKFNDLLAAMPAVRQARIDALTDDLRQDMDLSQLRMARRLSQAALGERLQVGQPAVAKLERRTDMYVGTLRRFVEAMGGELEIIARFPGHDVRIKAFGDLAESERR